MAAKHGTRRCYVAGCHCDACKAANRNYERERFARRANGEAPSRRAPVVTLPEQPVVASGPRPVERAVTSEIGGSTQADMRPALVETAVSLARILDNPRAISPQAAAAGKLADILDRLHKGAAPSQGGPKLVRAMTTTDGGA
jgi:hypothetical protein